MKLVLLGGGRMGRAVEERAEARDHEVVDVLDGEALRDLSADDLAGRLDGADAAIDFTVAEQVARSVAAAAQAGVPLVIGTTGWADDADSVLAPARDADAPVLHGPNFSIGVHLFLRTVQEAARLMDHVDDYDVWLHEAHHRHKVDHPSGTGRRLADALVQAIARKKRWTASLEQDAAIDPAVLHVSSTRAGEIPGTHTVGFEGPHDSIELTHTARSRHGFAHGAVWGAEWLRGRTGIHTFEDALDDLLGAEDA